MSIRRRKMMVHQTLYQKFLYEFHTTRDYFECHELLEELWKKTAEKSLNKIHPIVVLLQLSVSCYHWRRKNNAGAKKLLKCAITKFDALHGAFEPYGIDEEKLFTLIQKILIEIDNNSTYKDFNLPLTNRACIHFNDDFFQPSDMDNLALIHRHLPQFRK